MIIALYLLSILLGIVFPKSKRVTLFILLVALLVFCGNTDNPDYLGYQDRYYSYQAEWVSEITPIGFIILSHIGNTLGLSFPVFRAVLGAASIAFIYDFIRRYSNSTNAVLAIYLCISFLLDVVQFRFYLAAAIALWGIHFIIDGNGIKRMAVYVSVVVFAMSLHPVSIVFLSFLAAKLPERWCRSVSVAVAAIILTLLYSGFAQWVAPTLVGELRAERYFASISRIGFIPYAVIGVSAVIPAILTSRSKAGIHKSQDGQANSFSAFISNAAFCMLPILSTLILRPEEFFRPVRIILIMFVIYTLNHLASQAGRISKDVSRRIILCLIVWTVCTTLYSFREYVFTVVVPVLTQNALLF